MLKVGEHAEEIDPWLNLIPDAYGLCVVKASFALLLNVRRAFTINYEGDTHAKFSFRGQGISQTIENLFLTLFSESVILLKRQARAESISKTTRPCIGRQGTSMNQLYLL